MRQTRPAGNMISGNACDKLPAFDATGRRLSEFDTKSYRLHCQYMSLHSAPHSTLSTSNSDSIRIHSLLTTFRWHWVRRATVMSTLLAPQTGQPLSVGSVAIAPPARRRRRPVQKSLSGCKKCKERKVTFLMPTLTALPTSELMHPRSSAMKRDHTV